jgi:hypothetical protein
MNYLRNKYRIPQNDHPFIIAEKVSESQVQKETQIYVI